MKKLINILCITFLLYSCSTVDYEKIYYQLIADYSKANSITQKELEDKLLAYYYITVYNDDEKFYDIKGESPIKFYGISSTKEETPTELNMLAIYSGQDWILFEKVIFYYGHNKTYTIDLASRSELETIAYANGDIVEGYSYPLNDDEIKKLEEIMRLGRVKYRFEGKYSHEGTLTKLSRMRNLGLIYLYLGNKK